jgi:hypothetical protein
MCAHACSESLHSSEIFAKSCADDLGVASRSTTRSYGAADILRVRGGVVVEYTLVLGGTVVVCRSLEPARSAEEVESVDGRPDSSALCLELVVVVLFAATTPFVFVEAYRNGDVLHHRKAVDQRCKQCQSDNKQRSTHDVTVAIAGYNLIENIYSS